MVDSSCDLPSDYIQDNSIEILPMPFDLDGKDYNAGYWGDISAKEYYDALRNGSIAKTSQINPAAFITTFKEYAGRGAELLYITLSSGLSSTFHNSIIAIQTIKETYPNCGLYPVDSISASSGAGLLAMLAVKKRAEGLSAAETAAWLEEKKHSCMGLFTVDDLMYLHRGGRLSK